MYVSRILRAGAILALAVGASLAEAATSPAEKLTRKELKALLAAANTPADHQRIAAYYRSEAERSIARQQEHEEELAEYYRNPLRFPGKYPTKGDHCRSLAGYYRLATERAISLAQMHERLAQDAR